jgi:hypothetical protein
MAFFDPVDPSTESSLWPVRVGFCIVASAAVWLRLPLVDRRGHEGAVAAIGVDPAACRGRPRWLD